MRVPGRSRLSRLGLIDFDSLVAAEVKARDRDRYLAALYAPATARAGLMALFGLDLELAQIVTTTTDPMVGAIRLAWWREALQGLDAGRVPAQPLLQALAAHLLPAGISGNDVSGLEDRWLDMIDADTVADSHIAGGALLFRLAARLLGGDVGQAQAIGRAWVLGEGVAATTAPSLRPLLGLARLAERDAQRSRAGKPREVRGTLPRQWLLLRAVALGR